MAVFALGKQHASAWFEAGLAGFFSHFDLRDSPSDRFRERRKRSRGMRSVRRKLERDNDWNPPLGPLLRSTFADQYSAARISTSDFESISESVVDLLLTNRKAAKLRATLIQEMARAAAGGSGGATFKKHDLRRLQSLWHAHLKSVLLVESAR